jgi:hypothetical protein
MADIRTALKYEGIAFGLAILSSSRILLGLEL